MKKAVEAYLAGLPDDRRKALATVRELILENLPEGYEEAFGSGAIVYQVPLSVCPDTYNGQPLMYVALASQKNYMAVYLMCAYSSPAVTRKLKQAFARAGKKLDMGKSCVRFKKLEDLSLDAIGGAVASHSMRDYVDRAQRAQARPAKKRGR